MGSGSRGMHFSPRRRTAVVLVGEGTGAAYLVGAMRALDAAGVRPFRIAPIHRFAALCLATSFAFFAAPALLGLVAVVVLPVQALVRGIFPAAAAGSPSWLSGLVSAVEPYYLPAVALPGIVLFL